MSKTGCCDDAILKIAALCAMRVPKLSAEKKEPGEPGAEADRADHDLLLANGA